MLAGIVPAQADGHEPKHIDPYLEVVVDEILDLSGATFFDAYKSASFTFKVALLSYVLDYPGLGKVFTAAGPNALQGCMWCEIRGRLLKNHYDLHTLQPKNNNNNNNNKTVIIFIICIIIMIMIMITIIYPKDFWWCQNPITAEDHCLERATS